MQTSIIRIDPLDPAQHGYPILLLTWPPPAGPAPAPLAYIPENLQLAGMPYTFDAQGMCASFTGAAGPTPALQDVGAQLYTLLTQDAALVLALQTPDQRTLLDIRAPGLQPLPWELLWRTHDHSPLFGDPQRPICRGALTEGASLPALDEWPLRLMLAIGSRANDPAVRAEQELERVMAALTPCDPDIDLLIWKRGSKASLVAEIQRFKPHILHFVGHGQVATDGSAVLELMTDAGSQEKWEPTAIRNDGLPPTLRLVVINACRSGNAGQTEALNRNGMWSVTDAFMAAGVPAVIGMRTDVAGEDAARFAARFYQALADGVDLDIAVAQSRQAVYQPLPDGLKRREWASPCLQVRYPPDQIVRIGAGIAPDRRKSVKNAHDFRENRSWVDRRLERRQAWVEMAGRQRSLLVVEGDDKVGKTSFAHMLMERCSLCGHDVRYVDLKTYIDADPKPPPGTRRGDFLTVLRAVRDGSPSNDKKLILRQPLPAKKFALFNQTINQVLGATPPAGQEDVDQMVLLTQAANTRAEELISVFRDCLVQVVDRPPLVIVLDHLKPLTEDNFIHYLSPFLLDWCIDRPDIRIVLLLTSAQYLAFDVEQQLAPNFDHVKVNDFSPDDWEDLAIEYLRRTRVSEPAEFFEGARAILPQVRKLWKINGPWKPGALKMFDIEIG
jgi:hypothetical protein